MKYSISEVLEECCFLGTSARAEADMLDNILSEVTKTGLRNGETRIC